MRKVSYKKLMHMLLDRNIKKFEFQEMAGIGRSSLYKLIKDENVNVSVLVKVCDALNCDITDIMELIPADE